MSRKRTFSKEAPTNPGRRSAPVAKGKGAHEHDEEKRSRAEAPTMPPPPPPGAARGNVTSGVRPRRASTPAAAIDEVTADLSRDPRREHDDDSPKPPRTRPKR